ncbi:MAG: hypothetical protein ACP5D2_03495 [Candidatus Nanoarchaeia archaeon]
MPEDEEIFEDDNLDEELEQETEQVKKAPKKKQEVVDSGEEDGEAKERYEAFHVPETFGIRDNVTGDLVVVSEKKPTLSEMEVITLQSEAKAMNDRDKIIVGGGFE